MATWPIGGQAGAYDPPYPHATYKNFPGNGPNDTGYLRWPDMTVGKFYYTDNGVNKVCSGSVVNGPHSGGVVFLAGHCLYDVGIHQWTTNWVFAPGADNLNKPFGLWSWKYALAWQGYMTTGDEVWDYATVSFFSNSGGGTMNSAVGGLGLVYNADYRQHWHVWGYPDGDPERQWICSASWAASDIPPGGQGEAPTVGIGCDQTGGMGGGPWLMQVQPGDVSAYLNSVTAYTSGHSDLYGDYFDSNAATMYNDMEAHG